MRAVKQLALEVKASVAFLKIGERVDERPVRDTSIGIKDGFSNLFKRIDERRKGHADVSVRFDCYINRCGFDLRRENIPFFSEFARRRFEGCLAFPNSSAWKTPPRWFYPAVLK